MKYRGAVGEVQHFGLVRQGDALVPLGAKCIAMIEKGIRDKALLLALPLVVACGPAHSGQKDEKQGVNTESANTRLGNDTGSSRGSGVRLHETVQKFDRVCLVLDTDTIPSGEIVMVSETGEALRPDYTKADVELAILSQPVGQSSEPRACADALATSDDDSTLIVILSKSRNETEIKLRRGAHALDAKWPLDELDKNTSKFLKNLILQRNNASNF